jgi:hypothetical protein
MTPDAGPSSLNAQQQARANARRERQVAEIAALVVAGDRSRAAGLALEHIAEFPADAERLRGSTGGESARRRATRARTGWVEARVRRGPGG